MPDHRHGIFTAVRDKIQSFLESGRDAIYNVQRYNLKTFRDQPLAEISGSFGDLGTLLPILIALSESEAVWIDSSLVFGGIANIVTGCLFGIPLPVQPMKAISAVALAQGLNRAEVASAGLIVAGVVGFLSLTGLLQWFARWIPIPVIKGIQVGTGLSLVTYVGTLATPSTWNAEGLVTGGVVPLILFLALLCIPLYPRVPFALLAVMVGLLYAVSFGLPCWFWPCKLGPTIWEPTPRVPSPTNFRSGMLQAGLGQIPLTTLNSVFAVAFLAGDLFPDRPEPSITGIGLSVMAFNLVGCWYGAMPICHGSGGLAAQYRFGARSGASVIFLGIIKLFLGLFFGNFFWLTSKAFPKPLLAVLVFAAGLELVKVGQSLNTSAARDLRENIRKYNVNSTDQAEESEPVNEEEKARRYLVMFATVGGILAYKNDLVGFLLGMASHWTLKSVAWVQQRRSTHGQIRLER